MMDKKAAKSILTQREQEVVRLVSLGYTTYKLENT